MFYRKERLKQKFSFNNIIIALRDVNKLFFTPIRKANFIAWLNSEDGLHSNSNYVNHNVLELVLEVKSS